MLILARHGSTENNITGRLQGMTDSKLIQFGYDQVLELSKEMSKFTVSKIYCSTLSRAVNTAEVLQKSLKTELIADDRLVERNFGPFEGLTRSELIRSRNASGLSGDDPTQAWSWDLRFEQDAEVFSRFLDFCRSYNVLDHSQSSDIVIVTHANFIKCIIYNLLSVGISTPKAFKIREASFLSLHVEIPAIIELRELWQNPLIKS